MDAIREKVPLAPYTIYNIGGPADFFVEVKNFDELREALRFATEHGLPFFILGAGSNILVSDKGFQGVVIHMKGGGIRVEGGNLVVTADVMMAHAVLKSAEVGLIGLEWGVGVPGTIGGSVRGNAGCYGGEMKDVVKSVRMVWFPDGFRELQNKECNFSYRDSIFKHHPEWIIVSVTLALNPGDPKEIRGKIQDIVKKRSREQDIGTKSCGCIFKNIFWPEEAEERDKLVQRFPGLEQFANRPTIPASFLIDQTGLKGTRMGKVFISPKHGNFFVNDGGAMAEDVRGLIALAKERVRQKYGLLLEEEIQYVGF